MGLRQRTFAGRRARRVPAAVVVLSITTALSACSTDTPPATLTIATTTSVDQSGLLGALTPAYESEAGVEVRAHATGSGQALQMLARGDADVAISHSPNAEAATLRSHPDWIYRKFAFEELLIVGPPSDPARVRGSANAVDAFVRIAQSSAQFVSRADQSGTLENEVRLWTLAGQRPGADRLIVSSHGMAQALRHADEAEAYTLSDEITFHRFQQQLDLAAHYRGDALLVNTYAVVYRPNDALAEHFALWLTVGSGRAMIRSFTVDGRNHYAVWPKGCYGSAPIDQPCGMGAKR
jgi:tungstate transport system substrate-binding protein